MSAGISLVGLTSAQSRLLALIASEADAGRSPSYDQMATHIGLASKSGIVRLIDGLEERGRIRRIANRARSICLVDAEPLAGFSTDSLIAELKRRHVAEQGL